MGIGMNDAATMASATDRSPSPAIFPSDPRVKSLHRILTHVPSSDLDEALSSSQIQPLPELVESVLLLCHSSPSPAMRFFRWAARSIKHTPYAWNLMVDILGKNGHFEDMWNAIKAMKDEPSSALSLSTFSSAFESYCSAGSVKEAVMTFKVMDRYGLVKDVTAVNSLLTAICRHTGRTSEAADFLDQVKAEIKPDKNTFTILLEGWENEGNVVRAKRTFSEMASIVGWKKENVPAYDAFLTTLVRGYEIEGAMKFLKVIKDNNCLPGLKFFRIAMNVLFKKRDFKHALFLWEIMVVQGEITPNLRMYHSMIVLSCENDNVECAYKLLDEMPFNGAFPDSATYCAILDCLVRLKKAKEAEKFFVEMRKNEKVPSSSACASSIRMFFKEFDPVCAGQVWRCVIEEKVSPADECAQEMILGLLSLERMRQVRLCIEEMLDNGIVLGSSTHVTLKTTFHKAGLGDLYERRLKHLH